MSYRFSIVKNWRSQQQLLPVTDRQTDSCDSNAVCRVWFRRSENRAALVATCERVIYISLAFPSCRLSVTNPEDVDIAPRRCSWAGYREQEEGTIQTNFSRIVNSLQRHGGNQKRTGQRDSQVRLCGETESGFLSTPVFAHPAT